LGNHTIDGRIKKWDNKKCLTFQDNVDKENLNRLYNELTNSISENNNFKITKILKKAWRTNIIVNNIRVSTS
jgi:CRISPR/Cas system endoribonuclease Cas6 (RAMP superfamily)